MIAFFPYFAKEYVLYEELFSFDGISFYNARNLENDIDYILKMFPKDQKGMKDRFINEITLLKKLEHPNIAHIYCHFEDDSFFTIVFEKWNFTLKQRMKFLHNKKKGISRISLLSISTNKIISQILNGVQFCHQNGIYHLNLNLSTIVIDKYENAKLIGFDYATTNKNSNDDIQVSSDYEFESPEILLKMNKKISFSSDIWSLGVIFYFLNYGKSTWPKTTNDKEKIHLIESGKVNLSSKKDSSLTFILHQMLVVNPDMRKPIDAAIEFFDNKESSSTIEMNLKSSPSVQLSNKMVPLKKRKSLKHSMYQIRCPYGMIHFLKKQPNHTFLDS